MAVEGALPDHEVSPPLAPEQDVLPYSFVATIAHFAEWENRARAFMQTPRGRLVWKVGGVFWRLALYFVEAIEPAHALFDVAPKTGNSPVTPSTYEEALTDGEIDLMTGLHRVAPGK